MKLWKTVFLISSVGRIRGRTKLMRILGKMQINPALAGLLPAGLKIEKGEFGPFAPELYDALLFLENLGWLRREETPVDSVVRNDYTITERGTAVLNEKAPDGLTSAQVEGLKRLLREG